MQISGYLRKVRNSQVAVNAGFLLIIQLINFIFPLVTLKYLLEVLGVAYFGKISFALAFIGYIVILVDYGFNISATRQIAIHKNDRKELTSIFCNVYCAKFILLIISFIVFSICVLQLDRFAADKSLYLGFFGMVIGLMLFPQWYFQGIEKMGYITLVNALIKIVFLLLIFLVVKNKSDYSFLPLIYSTSYFVPGIYAFLVAKKKVGPIIIPTIKDVFKVIAEGFNVFISTAMWVSLSGSAVFILGLLSNESMAGYYAGYDRLAKAAVMLFNPITLAIYPAVSRRFALSRSLGYAYIKKVGIPTIAISVGLAISLSLFSGVLTKYLYQPDFLKYRPVLYILSAWFVISLSNNFIGVQYLTAIGKSRVYAKSCAIAAFISFFILYFLTLHYSYIGTAIAVLISELLLAFFMLLFIALQRDE